MSKAIASQSHRNTQKCQVCSKCSPFCPVYRLCIRNEISNPMTASSGQLRVPCLPKIKTISQKKIKKRDRRVALSRPAVVDELLLLLCCRRLAAVVALLLLLLALLFSSVRLLFFCALRAALLLRRRCSVRCGVVRPGASSRREKGCRGLLRFACAAAYVPCTRRRRPCSSSRRAKT